MFQLSQLMEFIFLIFGFNTQIQGICGRIWLGMEENFVVIKSVRVHWAFLVIYKIGNVAGADVVGIGDVDVFIVIPVSLHWF